MSGPKRIISLAALLAVVPTVAHAASSDTQLRGRWQQLRTGPLTLAQGPTGVWTGRQLILVGRTAVTALDSRGNPYTVESQTAAEAYDPVANRWTRLSPPPGPEYVPGYKSVWTGKGRSNPSPTTR